MDATLPEVLGDKVQIQVSRILRDNAWLIFFISIMKELNCNIQTSPRLQEKQSAHGN